MTSKGCDSSELHRKIKDILLNEWDPIGIAGIDEAEDEYDAYVPAVYQLLITGAPKDDIAKYLYWLETEYMGLNGNIENTKQIAKRLKDLLA